MFFQILVHKDVGKNQIFNFFKEKKDLLIQEIKTSVGVKKKEIQRILTNELSKYIIQNKTSQREISLLPQTYIPTYKVHKVESYILKKEEMFRNSLKILNQKNSVNQDLDKSRNLLRRSSLAVSNLHRNSDKNDIFINKIEFDRKFEQTVSFKTIQKKKSQLFEEDEFKINDSLEDNNENKSKNKQTLNDNFNLNTQNINNIEKMMKTFQPNYSNRIHSSINLKRGITYDKDLIFIKPINHVDNLIPSKKIKVVEKGTSVNEEGINEVFLNLTKKNFGKTSENFKIPSKSENKDYHKTIYPDIFTNDEIYKFLDIKYSGLEKDTIKKKGKHISPEVQMKYFKVIRKKKLNIK